MSSPSIAADSTVVATPTATELVYTICPVLSGANVAAELGWLDEEIKKTGTKLSYLGALPEEIGWLPHFNHKLGNLIRDGGNIPSIWAKADTADTKLIGLTWATSGGQIVVRTDSDIHRVADLKGRRFALPRNQNFAKVDWWRGTAERGIEVALALAGLSRSDVQIVDLPHPDNLALRQYPKPSAVWAERRNKTILNDSVEVAALAAGTVDAVYANHGSVPALIASGRFTVIEDLSRHPDWTLQVANSPYAITVSAVFADKHPEVVIAFLRAAIRAGRWVNANREAAGEILHRVTFYPSASEAIAASDGVDFVPNLSPQNLAGLAIEKDFLRSHGYVKNDVDVNQWADRRFLEEAIRSL
jgi:ABC-type nitrate/sulfonate/bicarbonate transport system substrate-binding protein